ncbi:MAG TPA: hypothetical protein VNN73_03590 [Blastocatellia bacterium]|nr:hypothetical protein [Blastocatellia bacterium]
MQSKTLAGIIAGLIAGLVFGVMMQMMMTPDSMPMMSMVAKVVRSDSILVGWLYHLFNSAVIGGLFGWLLGNRIHGYGAGLGWGALYGVVWWVLGALVLMPILLGMSAFAPLMMEMMRPVATSSLMGHIIYGLILGAGFVALRHETPSVMREA